MGSLSLSPPSSAHPSGELHRGLSFPPSFPPASLPQHGLAEPAESKQAAKSGAKMLGCRFLPPPPPPFQPLEDRVAVVLRPAPNRQRFGAERGGIWSRKRNARSQMSRQGLDPNLLSLQQPWRGGIEGDIAQLGGAVLLGDTWGGGDGAQVDLKHRPSFGGVIQASSLLLPAFPWGLSPR